MTHKLLNNIHKTVSDIVQSKFKKSRTHQRHSISRQEYPLPLNDHSSDEEAEFKNQDRNNERTRDQKLESRI
ncbi:hypothetical protein M0813_28610 [Anaeramoeba flamelloides]|uniref:Uncharacterized protein n=1 Tax=Anaeramoeba flamelloides TaxID=1746091 RepID=A0ABQ8XT48_9EUKA|nr:hypothetical protein M0813_28610 [Anaeramoeba flamelloides]